MTDELQELLDQVHPDIGTFEYNEFDVPCIILDGKRFDSIIQKVAGRPISMDTTLNILQDGLGHVFVEVALDLSSQNIHEKILLYANTSLDFFELLSETSMLALTSNDSISGGENVFMIQIPRPEKATDALDMIKEGLAKSK